MKQMLAVLFCVLTMPSVWADYKDEHKDHRKNHDDYEAREVVERGDAVAYSELAAAVSDQFLGRIIRVELDRDWGKWYYKLRLLEADGRIIKIKMNAKNLNVIRVEGKTLETVVKIP